MGSVLFLSTSMINEKIFWLSYQNLPATSKSRAMIHGVVQKFLWVLEVRARSHACRCQESTRGQSIGVHESKTLAEYRANVQVRWCDVWITNKVLEKEQDRIPNTTNNVT